MACRPTGASVGWPRLHRMHVVELLAPRPPQQTDRPSPNPGNFEIIASHEQQDVRRHGERQRAGGVGGLPSQRGSASGTREATALRFCGQGLR
jgi:hypothetical protein